MACSGGGESAIRAASVDRRPIAISGPGRHRGCAGKRGLCTLSARHPRGRRATGEVSDYREDPPSHGTVRTSSVARPSRHIRANPSGSLYLYARSMGRLRHHPDGRPRARRGSAPRPSARRPQQGGSPTVGCPGSVPRHHGLIVTVTFRACASRVSLRSVRTRTAMPARPRRCASQRPTPRQVRQDDDC